MMQVCNFFLKRADTLAIIYDSSSYIYVHSLYSFLNISSV